MSRFALKNGVRLFLIVALFLVTTIITSLGAVMNPASAQDSKPTIVLVHGAFAESFSWNGVLTQLIPKGYPTVAVANSLRGVKSDQIMSPAFSRILDLLHESGGMCQFVVEQSRNQVQAQAKSPSSIAVAS